MAAERSLARRSRHRSRSPRQTGRLKLAEHLIESLPSAIVLVAIKAIPGRLRAEITMRQEGRCADCGTRLMIRFFVFDHRRPLALREPKDDANDPDRLVAICWTCNEQKTPKDINEIARAKRLADKRDFLERQRGKVLGRRAATRKQWERSR